MTVSTHTARPDSVRVVAKAIALLTRIGAKSNAALKAFQMAQMCSTLSSMSDYQLAQIGISRSDIPKYAETLMVDD